MGTIMHACFNALKAFMASFDSDTHSDFLLAPFLVRYSLRGCVIHANPLMTKKIMHLCVCLW